MAKKLFINAQEQEAVSKKAVSKVLEDDRGFFEEINYWFASHASLSLKDKVTFFRLFATMVNAGIPITKSLDILQGQIESPKLQLILKNLHKQIENGSTLASSLELYPDEFSDADVGMIRSGEVSGRLNMSLLNLANQVEKSESLTKKLKGAMIYPAVIFLLLIAALFAVMNFVIPQIKEMFESFDAELPWITQKLINFSDFMIATGGPFDLPNSVNIILSFVIFMMALMYWKKTKSGKYYWDVFLLSLPIFGVLNKKVAIAKMTRGLSTLLSSGLSIVKALIVCADIIGSEPYKRRLLRTADDVKQGISIADNLRGDTKFFPPMVISMFGVGEQTAQLDKMTLKIAEFYEDEVEDMVKNLSALLEPVIIVVVGLSVGGLVVAVMLPILSLSDLAGG